MAEPMSLATEELGRRIRDWRTGQGLTQEELASGSGVDSTTIGKIERGERNPNVHNLIRIAVALGVDPGQLLRGMKGDMVPTTETRPTPAERFQRKTHRGRR
ncbi:MAG: helix-turn-helix domain-containing protein [Humibacter sp.]